MKTCVFTLLALLASGSAFAQNPLAEAGDRKPLVYCVSNQTHYPEVKLDIINNRYGKPYVLAGRGVEMFPKSLPRSITFGGVIDRIQNVPNGVYYTFRDSNYRYLDGKERKLDGVFVTREKEGYRVQINVDKKGHVVTGCQLADQ